MSIALLDSVILIVIIIVILHVKMGKVQLRGALLSMKYTEYIYGYIVSKLYYKAITKQKVCLIMEFAKGW